MCYWEGPAPEFINEQYISSARKKHKCLECYQDIPIGFPYKKISGKWDGYFEVVKQCSLCARIWEDLVDNGFCPDFGGLWEYINEEFEQPDE